MIATGIIATYSAIVIAAVAGVGLIGYWVNNMFEPITAIEKFPPKILEEASQVMSPVAGAVSAGLNQGLNQVSSVPSNFGKVPEAVGNLPGALGNIPGANILPSSGVSHETGTGSGARPVIPGKLITPLQNSEPSSSILSNIPGKDIMQKVAEPVANLIGKLPANPISSIGEHLPAVPHLELPTLPVAMPTMPTLPHEIPGKNILSSFGIGR